MSSGVGITWKVALLGERREGLENEVRKILEEEGEACERSARDILANVFLNTIVSGIIVVLKFGFA